MSPDLSALPSFKSVIHNQRKEIFKEFERQEVAIRPSKLTHIKERTLFTLDYRNIQNTSNLSVTPRLNQNSGDLSPDPGS